MHQGYKLTVAMVYQNIPSHHHQSSDTFPPVAPLSSLSEVEWSSVADKLA